ncbi:MAG: ester cyclase [Anaerolineae bacterium]|nr:ester cyclase [Anaerolineae bacterium]
MSTEENKAISRQWREEFDKKNWAALDEFVAPNVVMHFAGNPDPLGFEEMKQMLKMFYSAFPDLHHTFDDQIAEGDKVVLRLTFRGTHQGEFQGIPPTGKKIEVTATVVDRIVDGKMVEHWSTMDNLSLMQQLGVIPVPEAA